MSIKTRIGGLIIGWIFSLVVALVTGLVKRAMAKQQQAAQMRGQNQRSPHPSAQSASPRPTPAEKPATYKTWAVTDTIFQGMSKAELVAAYGQPSAQMKSSSTSEVWTYDAKLTANDNVMTVTIENGFVTDWTEAASTVL